MGLQQKFQKLLTLGAAVMVIQECSQPFIKQLNGTLGWPSRWFGKNLNKGLGVLVRAPWIIREARALKPKWTGKLVTSIELFPVWACEDLAAIVARRFLGATRVQAIEEGIGG